MFTEIKDIQMLQGIFEIQMVEWNFIFPKVLFIDGSEYQIFKGPLIFIFCSNAVISRFLLQNRHTAKSLADSTAITPRVCCAIDIAGLLDTDGKLHKCVCNVFFKQNSIVKH